MEKEPTWRDFPVNRDNPFIKSLIVRSGYKMQTFATKKGDAIMNLKTGELSDDAIFLSKKERVDKDKFVKLYVDSVSALFDLSRPAQKVFTFILQELEYSDRVIFNMRKCRDVTGYSSDARIYRGLADLVKAEFIAKSEIPNVFFVNPQVFYKGDRLVLINQYTVENSNKEFPVSDFENEAQLKIGEEKKPPSGN